MSALTAPRRYHSAVRLAHGIDCPHLPNNANVSDLFILSNKNGNDAKNDAAQRYAPSAIFFIDFKRVDYATEITSYTRVVSHRPVSKLLLCYIVYRDSACQWCNEFDFKEEERSYVPHVNVFMHQCFNV